MKIYTFKVVIKEGCDEFWEAFKDRTGCDEVLEAIRNCLGEAAWIDHSDEVTLERFEDTDTEKNQVAPSSDKSHGLIGKRY